MFRSYPTRIITRSNTVCHAANGNDITMNCLINTPVATAYLHIWHHLNNLRSHLPLQHTYRCEYLGSSTTILSDTNEHHICVSAWQLSLYLTHSTLSINRTIKTAEHTNDSYLDTLRPTQQTSLTSPEHLQQSQRRHTTPRHAHRANHPTAISPQMRLTTSDGSTDDTTRSAQASTLRGD